MLNNWLSCRDHESTHPGCFFCKQLQAADYLMRSDGGLERIQLVVNAFSRTLGSLIVLENFSYKIKAVRFESTLDVSNSKLFDVKNALNELIQVFVPMTVNMYWANTGVGKELDFWGHHARMLSLSGNVDTPSTLFRKVTGTAIGKAVGMKWDVLQKTHQGIFSQQQLLQEIQCLDDPVIFEGGAVNVRRNHFFILTSSRVCFNFQEIKSGMVSVLCCECLICHRRYSCYYLFLHKTYRPNQNK